MILLALALAAQAATAPCSKSKPHCNTWEREWQKPNPFDRFDPAKLIVVPPDQPALTIDYQSMERCQRARAELIRQDQEGGDNAKEVARQLGRPVIVRHLIAYCIPK